MNRQPRRIALLALLLLALGLAGLALRPPSARPLPLALWWWHRPFLLPDAERALLASAGIGELFVRAGTLRLDTQTKIAVALPQVWRSDAGTIGVHLVFNASPSLLGRLETVPETAVATALATAIQKVRNTATKAGVHVVGVQLDFDFPTRLLPRYAALVRALRPMLPTGLVLSITALPTWYTSRAMDALLDDVDFAVPQFYEASVPRDLEHFATVADPARLERGLRAADRRGRPFRAGLAAYGHALVYDGAGELRGVYRDAGAEAVARDPQFSLIEARNDTKSGERLVYYHAARHGATPFTLVFDLPTPQSLARQLARLREMAPRHATGAILFRYPEPGETATLPLTTLAALARGQTPAPRLSVQVHARRAAPWNAIEAGPVATEVRIALKNDGDGPTAIGPGSVELEASLDRPGIEEAQRGGFARAQPYASTFGAPASRGRSSGAVFSAAALAPGQTLTAGPIRIAGEKAGRVRVTWRVRLPDGATVLSGESEAKP